MGLIPVTAFMYVDFASCEVEGLQFKSTKLIAGIV